MSHLSKDILNIGSQAVVKMISVPFGLIGIGLASRRLSADDAYLLLAAQNALIMIGLLQLGLGSFILRSVSHAWAREPSLKPAADIRGGFLMILCAAALSLAALTIAFLEGLVPWVSVPLLLIAIIALVGQVADQVRVAIGEIFRSNVFQAASYLGCAVLLIAALAGHSPIIWLVFVAVFGPQSIANILSFSSLIRRADFRGLIAPHRPFDIAMAVRQSVPLLLVSMGTALMLNMPLAGHVLKGFPVIDQASLACCRLFTSGLTLCYFALQPLTPIILRYRYNDSVRFRRYALALLGSLVGVCLVGGVVFWLLAPAFIHLWLGVVQVPVALAVLWGRICALWLSLAVLSYFCQITSRPVIAAGSWYVACASTALAAYVFPGSQVEILLTIGLAIGLTVSCVGAFLAIKDAKRSDVHTGADHGIDTPLTQPAPVIDDTGHSVG